MTMKQCSLKSLSVVLILFPAMFAMAGSSVAMPGNLLENPGFEMASTGETENAADLPMGWGSYQWGKTGSDFEVERDPNTGLQDGAAVRASNTVPTARAGVYTHVELQPGEYELSVWTRSQPGKTGRVRMYLGRGYSRVFDIDDEWTQLRFQLALSQPVSKAEINVQNYSEEVNTVWFDDVVLRRVSDVRYERVKDTRLQRPRTLLFSPINVNYLKDSVDVWAKRGFRGFFFNDIMRDWASDVWASDGDATTRGVNDRLLQEVRAANRAGKPLGIDSNFVKVALKSELPHPFDEAGWKKLTANFREGARFAHLSECAGVAIDTEYVGRQFNPSWPGYSKDPRPLAEMKAKIQQRWHAVVTGMLDEYPDMILLSPPEGTRVYGELYHDLLAGMLQALARRQAPGGLHIFTELTYTMTDAAALKSYVNDLNGMIQENLSPELRRYWDSHCSIALGAWPFGYYRQVLDEKGDLLGYSGRREVFGDKIVGSYADKSARYSPERFAEQMAGLNSFSKRYNWIYGHGDVFTHLNEEQIAKYRKMAHRSIFSVEIPTATNLEEYFQSIRSPELVREQRQ